MALRLPDRWVWDFWHVPDGGDHHIFYLQAPRSLGDPDLRHRHATIGHAVSTDLVDWAILPDALGPGAPGSWDDYATWTGSIVAHDGSWNLLYTGTCRAEEGRIQRIGLATSDDLVTWERHGTAPVLEADPTWYELLDLNVWFDQAWRDPWVVPGPEGSGFHAYVTARAKDGDPAGRGVIGYARSEDLRRWEVLPPVTSPLGFGQMEVPQIADMGGRSYVLFCGDDGGLADDTTRRTGTFSLSAETPEGPFNAETLAVVDADAAGSTYAGKIVDGPDGSVFLAWLFTGSDGQFVGEIDDPRPVRIGPDGALSIGSRVSTSESACEAR